MPGIEGNNVPRYLQNTEQVLNPEESNFSGSIPTWLQGSLISSSPGVFDLENGSVQNWFDGYAIISKFQIEGGGKVTFKSKYLKSNAYSKAVEAKRPVFPEFGTPPWTTSLKLFAKLVPFGPYDCTDNVIGTIFTLGSESLYTAGDTCYYHKIDPTTLTTTKTYHTVKAFGMNSISSQPLEDPQGNVYLIGGAISPTFRYTVLKMPSSRKDKPLEKRFTPLTSFPSRWMFGACPCRNFGMSQNYIIMIEMPLVLNLMKLAATNVKGYCATDWLDWRPQDGVKFYLIHKESGVLSKVDVFSETPFFTPSIVNAFEEGEEIVMDVISMPNLSCNEATSLSNLRNRSDTPIPPEDRPLDSGTIHRYIIPLNPPSSTSSPPNSESLLQLPKSAPFSSTYSSVQAVQKGNRVILTPEILSEPGLGTDFVTMNPNFRGKRYTFLYTTAGYISLTFSPYAYGITKVNLDTKECLEWKGRRGQVPSEPVFVPNPINTAEEDDGILLALVKNERSYEEDDFLVAVDAKSMKEVGRACFKSGIAGWYHATFFKKNSTVQTN